MLLAIGAAVLSAAFFGASSALQQRVASSADKEGLSAGQLVGKLAQEPRWWLGLAMSAVAFALHAVALNGAMLAVVQPIVVSGLVFAVFVRAGLERRLPPRATIGWCTLTWAALAAFVVVVQTGPAQPAMLDAAGWCLAVSAGLVGGLVVAARMSGGERRGLLFGAGAGVLFGLVAGLAKVVLDELTSSWWLIATHWPFWALVVVGLGAILLNQRAFQATRLSVTMPMVNIVNVMVAIVFGFAVFGERLFSSPLTLGVEVLALVVMGVGVRQLASGDPDEDPPTSSAPSPDNAATAA
ncbi:MAG TPA: DMT family transporter [Propionibacteriaceae bacterium]